MSYILSCCSTADLTKEHFEKRDIRYICFHYSVDGVAYPDDLGQTMSYDEFYKRIRENAETKTWQVNADEYEQYFEGFLKEGKDIVHLSMSSGISGSYNSALIAKNILQEKYPDRKIYVIDSLAASSGYGLFMDKLADLRDMGYSADQLAAWAESNKLKLNHWFYSTDLTYYVKGGRVSKIAGWVGTILKLCPLLNCSKEGKLVPRQKLRGRARALEETRKKMEELADDGLDYSGKCYICHSDCIEEAEKLKAEVEQTFPKLNGEVEIYSIGTTIGCHTGVGTIALFFWGEERKN